jgi:hypothetical protein
MNEPRKPPFRTNRGSGPSSSRSGFTSTPRTERFMPEEDSSAHELLEMADSLTRQARELTAHAALLRRLAADLQEGEERPRPRAPRPTARPEGRGGFGGERGGGFESRGGGPRGGPRSRSAEGERPRRGGESRGGAEERPRKRSTGEAPAWAPKKRKK